jgi:hypothetical protein
MMMFIVIIENLLDQTERDLILKKKKQVITHNPFGIEFIKLIKK